MLGNKEEKKTKVKYFLLISLKF